MVWVWVLKQVDSGPDHEAHQLFEVGSHDEFAG